MRVTVVGGGPAGSSAAIAASQDGAPVELREKSRLPRHKVCGEFLSPEIVPLLEQLGVAGACLDAKPACIRRLLIRFGNSEKIASLPEAAYGLSRFVFDSMLLDRATDVGTQRSDVPDATSDGALVLAHGRRSAEARGARLFGFKAHFRGPSTDAIELHFFDNGYVGISSIENGLTNVCGLATESVLARIHFEYDELLTKVPGLAERIRPLSREMDWLTTGPLVYANRFGEPSSVGRYYAGDALSFVDPFTGSGMYCAVLTGTIAGRSAAQGVSSAEHVRRCRQALGRPFAFASLFRNAITSGWAQRVAPFVPAQWLYRLTRPARRSVA
jgi:hypothetical protein